MRGIVLGARDSAGFQDRFKMISSFVELTFDWMTCMEAFHSHLTFFLFSLWPLSDTPVPA